MYLNLWSIILQYERLFPNRVVISEWWCQNKTLFRFRYRNFLLKAEVNGIENNYLILFITCTSQTSLKFLFISKYELSALVGLVVKKTHYDTEQIKHLLIKWKVFQMILVYFITFSWDNFLTIWKISSWSS